MYSSYIQKIHLIFGLKNEITPVAEIEPVDLAGSLVKFVLLPDPPYTLYYNQKVKIRLVKGIFPQIQKEFLHKEMNHPPNARPIEMRRLLEEHQLLAKEKNGIWYLRDQSLLPNIQHFVKTLRIRGLGVKTIYKLCDRGAVNSIADLYRIPWILFHVCLGVKLHSPKVEKIRANIEQTKLAPWFLFLQALNIPGVTKKNIQPLVALIPNLSALMAPNALLLKQHFNVTFVENLIGWVHQNQTLLKELMAVGIGQSPNCQ